MSDASYERQNIIGCQRAVLWAEAKGKLDAITRLYGLGHESRDSHQDRSKKYQVLCEKIKSFVEDFENEGFGE